MVNHAPMTQQLPNTQTGSINASFDHDHFPTPLPHPVKEALQDINNIIRNQGQQVSERLKKLQFTVLNAVSNLQGRVDSLETQFSRLESMW